MTDRRWIVIVGWDSFQHYKNREVPWIKNYTRLLADPNYLMLTPHQRGVLHGLWLMYAESGRQIVDSTAWVTRQLCGGTTDRVTRATLEALNHAGFIEFSSRQPSRDSLALTRSREGETEREEQKPLNQDQRLDDTPLTTQPGSNGHDEDKPLTEEELKTLYQPKEIPW